MFYFIVVFVSFRCHFFMFTQASLFGSLNNVHLIDLSITHSQRTLFGQMIVRKELEDKMTAPKHT